MPLSTDFPHADQRYFNARSINPTQLIQITESTNVTPFNGQSR